MDLKDLDQFGEEFMRRIRDASTEEYQMLQSGELNSTSAKKIFRHFQSLKAADIKKVDAIVLDVMEMMLHKVLFMFEDNDTWAIVQKDLVETTSTDHLAGVSDGLAGELYSAEGWIAKFSKYKVGSMEEK